MKQFSSLTIYLLFVISSTSISKQIIVNKYGSVKTIHAALEIASVNDKIIIKSGNYNEYNLMVNKSLDIIGDGNPVINGENKGEVFTVRANDVIIEGLTIKNAAESFLSDNAGIKLDTVKNCLIKNNKLINNFFAIYLANSADCQVLNNIIIAHGNSEVTSGNGIHLWYCKNIKIENNNISGQRDGIYFEFVRNAKIVGNISHDNLRYGLHFMFSDSCEYWKNIFVHNGAGVAVMYTKFVNMHDNYFTDNWGAASYGVLLKEIEYSQIEKNNFESNTTGLYLEGCDHIKVDHNEFDNNGWAIKLMANSEVNTFISNNFIGNSFDIATNSMQNFNTFNGNYWSKYSGYDLNKDGVGDIPFRPVRLFSIMVEQQPTSLVLLHSFFINLLDAAESFIPALTPPALMDNSPIMRKIN